jgi:tetratricopeptide (TPR) repeat protein
VLSFSHKFSSHFPLSTEAMTEVIIIPRAAAGRRQSEVALPQYEELPEKKNLTNKTDPRLLTGPMDYNTSNLYEAQKQSFRIPFNHQGVPNIQNFVGRDDDLNAMEEYLRETPIRQRILVLWAAAGFGKTQLAVAFANKWHENFTSTFFLQGENSETLNKSVSDAFDQIWEKWAPELGRPTAKPGKTEDIRRLFLQWLSIQQNQRWLIIVDSVDGNDIEDFLPKGNHGSIIITTRRREDFLEIPNTKIQEIKEMNYEDSSKLLYQTENLFQRLDFSEPIPSKIEKDADRKSLLTWLDGCPIAIYSVGTKIRNSNISYKELLKRYKDNSSSTNLLSEKQLTIFHDDLAQLLESKEESHQRAARLLLLCSYLDPRSIWYNLLRKGLCDPDLPGWFHITVQTEGAFESAMEVLLSYALIRVDRNQNQVYNFHNVVREACQKFAEKQEKTNDYLRLAVTCLAYSYPDEFHLKSNDIKRRLSPHGDAVVQPLLDHLASGRVEFKGYRFRSLPEEKQKFILDLVREDEDDKSDRASFYGHPLRAVVELLLWTQRHEEAVKVSQAACKLPVGLDDKAILTTLYGWTLYRDKQLEKSLAPSLEAHKLTVEQFGMESKEGLFTARLIVAVKLALDPTDQETVRFGEEIVAICRRITATDSEYYDGVLTDQAEAYLQTGDVSKASKLYIEAYHITRAQLGPMHNTTLWKAGLICIQTKDEVNRLSEKLFYHRKVLEGLNVIFGPDHEETIAQARQLAWSYEEDSLKCRALVRRFVVQAMKKRTLEDDDERLTFSRDLRKLANALIDVRETMSAEQETDLEPEPEPEIAPEPERTPEVELTPEAHRSGFGFSKRRVSEANTDTTLEAAPAPSVVSRSIRQPSTSRAIAPSLPAAAAARPPPQRSPPSAPAAAASSAPYISTFTMPITQPPSASSIPPAQTPAPQYRAINRLFAELDKKGRIPFPNVEQEAVKSLEEALEVTNSLKLEDKKVTILEEFDIGVSYRDLSLYAKAAEIFQDVVDKYRLLLDTEVSQTRTFLSNLAEAYYESGQDSKVKPALKELLALSEAKLETEELNNVLKSNAKTCIRCHEYGEALDLLERIYDSVSEDMFSSNISDLRACLDYAQCLEELNDFHKAEGVLLLVSSAVAGRDHSEDGNLMKLKCDAKYRLAFVRYYLEDMDSAVTLLTEARSLHYELLAADLGKRTALEGIADSSKVIGEVYLERKEYDAAKAEFQRVLKLRVEYPNYISWQREACSNYFLARTYFETEAYMDCIACCKTARNYFSTNAANPFDGDYLRKIDWLLALSFFRMSMPTELFNLVAEICLSHHITLNASYIALCLAVMLANLDEHKQAMKLALAAMKDLNSSLGSRHWATFGALKVVKALQEIQEVGWVESGYHVVVEIESSSIWTVWFMDKFKKDILWVEDIEPIYIKSEEHLLWSEEFEIQLLCGQWVDLLPKLPHSFQKALRYNAPPDAHSIWPRSWTFWFDVLRPDEVQHIPIWIAGAPVVLPLEAITPVTPSLIPPPDPHPTISYTEPLKPHTIEEILLTFEFALGFNMLIDGRLQIFVPDKFDTSRALTDKPRKFGGLSVDYVRPTHLPSTFRLPLGSPTTRPFNSSVEINDPLYASIGKIKGRPGKLGLAVCEKTNPQNKFVTMSAHVASRTVKEKLSGRFRLKRAYSVEDWKTQVEIHAEDRGDQNKPKKFGNIRVLYDDCPVEDPPSQQYKHDICLVKPADDVSIVNTVAQVPNLGWLRNDASSIAKLRGEFGSKVKLLGDPTRAIDIIPSVSNEHGQIIGSSILVRQQPQRRDAILNRGALRQITSEISQCLILRVSQGIEAAGQSGRAIYVDRGEREGSQPGQLGPAVVGFVSFHEGERYVSIDTNMENADFRDLMKRAKISYWGAYPLPPDLVQNYDILSQPASAALPNQPPPLTIQIPVGGTQGSASTTVAAPAVTIQSLTHSPASLHSHDSSAALPLANPTSGVPAFQTPVPTQLATANVPIPRVSAGSSVVPQRAATTGGNPQTVPLSSQAVATPALTTGAPQPAASGVVRRTTANTNDSGRQDSLNSVTGVSIRQVLNQSTNLPLRSTGNEPMFVPVRRSGTFPLDASSRR